MALIAGAKVKSMPDRYRLPEELRATIAADRDDLAATERALKNFRYIVASVNGDAERVWSELWQQLHDGTSPAGIDMPGVEQGFVPEGGWAEFSEKLWLMKHYLDTIQRLCRSSAQA